MTEPDIIRIGGVEYELGPNLEDVSFTATLRNSVPLDCRVVILRPKRVQTGTICRRCQPDTCIFAWADLKGPSTCPGDGRAISPVPWYGTITEEPYP